MALEPGTYVFGPGDGTLTVHTAKGGVAAKAGHDLEIEVTRWRGTLEAGERPSIAVTADARSLRVRKASGGMAPFGDDEKRAVSQTIDEEVLKRTPIEYRSTRVDLDGDTVHAQGELELSGVRAPLALDLTIADGRLRGRARIKQTDWRMKPYSTLFGTLKVADVVEVSIDAAVPPVQHPEATGTRSRDDG